MNFLLLLFIGVYAHSDFDLAVTSDVHCHQGDVVRMSIPMYAGGNGKWRVELPETDWVQLVGDPYGVLVSGGLSGIQEFTIQCSPIAPVGSMVLLQLVRLSVDQLPGSYLAIMLTVQE